MMTEFAKLITDSANAIVPYMVGTLMADGAVLHDSISIRAGSAISARRFAKRSPAGNRERAARLRRCRRS